MADFRSASAVTTSTNGTCTITTPAGATTGDILVAFLLVDNTPSTISPPAGGWTALDDVSFGAVGAAFYLELAGAPGADFSFTSSNGTPGEFKGVLIAVNPDGDTFDAITDSDFANATSATGTTPNLTGVSAPNVLLCGFLNDGNRTVVTPPTGMDQRALDTSGASAVAVYSEVDTADNPIARSIVWSASDEALSIAVLLAFTAGGGGGGSILLQVANNYYSAAA